MNRREFSIQTLGTALAASAFMGQVRAQGAAPAEGVNYVKLSQPAPVSAPAGKIEVVEFFWYGCPHCNHFEPTLEPWVAKLPADVVFKRVPVAFRPNPYGIHQKLYFALDAMGLIPSMHAKVFRAIHEEGQRLDSPETIAAFLTKNGVDQARFMAVFNSFGLQTKAAQARTLSEAYKIDGVPSLGIAGQYYTTISLNGTPEKTLATADFLIAKARKGK